MGMVIIIGAGTGVSYGVAEKFGKEGFKIGLIARNEVSLKKLATSLIAKGIDVVYAIGDVTNEASLKDAFEKISQNEGPAEMILYNPSGVVAGDILELNWESVKSALDISIGGYLHLMKMVLPYYLQHNKGKLFVTGGGTALRGNPQMTALSIGKAGLRNLVQAFQQKVAGTQVHIAHLIINGYVQPSDEKYNPSSIAEIYWRLFLQQPGEFEQEIIY